MPRPFCRRRIGWLPGKWRFFPEGIQPDDPDNLTLTLDEMEAIRLADFLGLYQEEAAQKMGISRATFGRIIKTARKKVAEALISGKGLRIEEGPVEFDERCEFGPGHRKRLVGFQGGSYMNPERPGYRRKLGLGPEGLCVCPKCGFEKAHQPGIPCIQERCPHCHSALVRQGSEHYRLLKKIDRKKEP